MSVPLPGGIEPDTQRETPVFRASVRYLEVDVDVRHRGQFLTGLTTDDFELFEDNRRQTIDTVTFVDIPAAVDPDEDGVLARQPFSRRPESPEDLGGLGAGVAATPLNGFDRVGRIYAMVLGSGPREGITHLADTFIREYLGPGDLLAIVHAGGSRGQGLTNDKERLLAAVDRYRSAAMTEVYQTVKHVAVGLGAVTGRRKSILLVGEGEDLWAEREDIHDRWAYVRDATRTASAYNVPIHTISPRGMLVPLMVDGGASSPPLPGGVIGDGRESGRRLLSEDTNGLDLGSINSADKGFRRVVAQNTRYYILGYYSEAPRDGEHRPIKVRVKVKDASVAARRGIRALRPVPKPKRIDLPRTLSASARAALLGTPVAGSLPVEASVELFHGNDFKGALLVQASVNGRHLDLAQGRKLEFSVAAVDPQGVVRGLDARTFTFALHDSTRDRLQRETVTFFSRLELPAGRYAVRVSAHQPGGASGVATHDADIPDFAERGLSFSNLVVSSAAHPAFTLQADAEIRTVLSGAPPTRVRRFSRRESLTVFAEIYDIHWPIASELTAVWTVTKDGIVVISGERTMEMEYGGKGRFRGLVPLQALGPGDYVLRVEVLSMVASGSARAEITFQVEPDAEP